jgi:hypothetical protein
VVKCDKCNNDDVPRSVWIITKVRLPEECELELEIRMICLEDKQREQHAPTLKATIIAPNVGASKK